MENFYKERDDEINKEIQKINKQLNQKANENCLISDKEKLEAARAYVKMLESKLN